MNIYVIRNNHRFGPYDEKTLLSYVNNGQVLKQDKAIADGDSLERTVGFYLKQANLKSHVPNKGNVLAQLSAIGSELIFPKAKLFSKQFLSDQRILIMALVGLLPMIFMNIPLGGFFIFYEVSLYFSIIWGLFFYACWCGIAGYFLSFAHLYPKYRRGLYVLAISIPAIVHGLYDSFADLGAISLVMVFLGLMLLMMYLKQSVDYQSKLRQ